MNFKLRNLVAATLAGSFLMGFGATAMADSTTDIVNALVSKGVLTEEEGALLTKGREGEVAGAAKKPKIVEKNGNFSFESADGKNSIALTGRVHLDARANNVNNEPASGTVGHDYASNSNTSKMGDSLQLRRARIGVKGKVYGNFEYEAIVNAVGSNTNIVDVAYVNANIVKQAQVKVGQFKQPFNLEEYGTSSNNIDFMERSYVNQLAPGKKPGLMLHGTPIDGVTYAGSVYQQNAFGETDTASDGKGIAGRFTANIAELANWQNSVFHVGISGFDSEYGITPTNTANTEKNSEQHTRATVFSFADEAGGFGTAYRAQVAGDVVPSPTCTTTAPSSTCTVSGGYGYGTRSGTNAKVNNKTFGLELAAARGPFKFQTEYANSDFEATHANSGNAIGATAEAVYAEVLWMITGENYSDWYKNGAWGAVKPKNDFDLSTLKGTGAWELGLRFDQFMVGDTTSVNSSVSGANKNRFQGSTSVQTSDQNYGQTNGATGGAKTYTAGIKWTINPDVRVMLNYTHTKFDYAFSPIDVTLVGASTTARIDHSDTLMMRTQIAF